MTKHTEALKYLNDDYEIECETGGNGIFSTRTTMTFTLKNILPEHAFAAIENGLSRGCQAPIDQKTVMVDVINLWMNYCQWRKEKGYELSGSATELNDIMNFFISKNYITINTPSE